MISPEMIGVLITAGSGLVIGGVAWGKSSNRQDDLKEDLSKIKIDIDKKIDSHIEDNQRTEANVKAQLQRQWEWQHSHEQDVSDKRYELQKELGKIEATLAIQGNQYNEILRLIQRMDSSVTAKFELLDAKVDKLSKN